MAAFSHSIELAHAGIFILLIVLGLIAYVRPGLTVRGVRVTPTHAHRWQVATFVLGAIVAIRLALAPYWVWQEGHRALEAANNKISLLENRPQVGTLDADNKKRLGTVLFQLSELLNKKGVALAVQSTQLSGLRTRVLLPQLQEKLIALQDAAGNFNKSLFEEFVPNNPYYVHQIFQILKDYRSIGDLRNQINEYIIIAKQVEGIDAGKAEIILSTTDGHLAKAAFEFSHWVNESNQRIEAARAMLR